MCNFIHSSPLLLQQSYYIELLGIGAESSSTTLMTELLELLVIGAESSSTTLRTELLELLGIGA